MADVEFQVKIKLRRRVPEITDNSTSVFDCGEMILHGKTIAKVAVLRKHNDEFLFEFLSEDRFSWVAVIKLKELLC